MVHDWTRELADLAATDTGRGSAALAGAVRADLGVAASSLAADPASVVAAVLTGFYIPRADPPAAETDGPLGACLLALTLAALGGRATLVTDEWCAPVVAATLAAGQAEVGPLPGAVDVRVSPGPAEIEGLTHLVSVERVGRTADGSYRNMRGTDIGDVTGPLDELFLSARVPRIAVGDGGNEIGMGRLPAELIADVVDHGELIRCVVDCDQLVVAGTSNWGAHALASAVAHLAGGTVQTARLLGEEWSQAVLKAGVAAGAVDGVTAAPTPSVDGLEWNDYWRVPAQIGAHLAAQQT